MADDGRGKGVWFVVLTRVVLGVGVWLCLHFLYFVSRKHADIVDLC